MMTLDDDDEENEKPRKKRRKKQRKAEKRAETDSDDEMEVVEWSAAEDAVIKSQFAEMLKATRGLPEMAGKSPEAVEDAVFEELAKHDTLKVFSLSSLFVSLITASLLFSYNLSLSLSLSSLVPASLLL